MSPEPDLAGYREAQIRMIAKTGTTVEFFLPSAVVWPEDAILDPETGKPYDPAVLPLSSGFASASAKCGVAVRPGRREEATVTAIGVFEDGEGALLVPLADYEAEGLDDATECLLFSERYDIGSRDQDGIGDEAHRMILRIRQKGVAS